MQAMSAKRGVSVPGWIALALVLAAALGFHYFFEITCVARPNLEWPGSFGNPFRAGELWFKSMGRPLVEVRRSAGLPSKVDHGTFLLIGQETLRDDEARALFSWAAEAGNHLVLTPDVLSKEIHAKYGWCAASVEHRNGVRVAPLARVVRADRRGHWWLATGDYSTRLSQVPGYNASVLERPPEASSAPQKRDEAEEERTGSVRCDPVTPDDAMRGNDTTRPMSPKHTPTVVMEDKSGIVAAQYRVGQGTLTLIASFDFMGNAHVGRYDNPDFLWWLVTGAADGPTVWMARDREVPSLFSWLREHATPVLIAASLLLILWLIRSVPRFGPVRPDRVRARLDLSAHLTASGRYLWRRGRGGALLDAVRARLQTSLAQRRPALAAAEPGRRAQLLADMAHLPGADVWAALEHPARTPEEFTAAIRILKTLQAKVEA